MFCISQQRSLAIVAATTLVLAAPAVFGESSRQIAPQPSFQVPAQAPGQAAPQTVPQTPAAAASPAIAGQPQNQTAALSIPTDPEGRGDLFMAQQRYQAAIEAYKSAPRSPEVWNKTGIAYQLMFNLVDASHCYQASLKMNSRNARVLNNLGTVSDAQKQYSDAERFYRKALKLEPDSGLIYKNLGTNLLAQHKYKKGWDAYKTALQIDPGIFTNTSAPRVQNPTNVQDRGAMNYYMARGCVRAGMNDCAIEYLRAALNEGFTNPRKIQADTEFAGLRGVPAFQQLLASQRQQ
jgi:tetratricopeptide (TPR) repeat protein